MQTTFAFVIDTDDNALTVFGACGVSLVATLKAAKKALGNCTLIEWYADC